MLERSLRVSKIQEFRLWVTSIGSKVCHMESLESPLRMDWKLCKAWDKNYQHWNARFSGQTLAPKGGLVWELVHFTLMKNQSCTQMRWCFLITCTRQFPRDQMCRYMPSQEKRKVSFTLVFLTWPPSERAMLNAKLQMLKKGIYFHFVSVLPITAKELLSGIACSFLSLMPCSWWFVEAAGACLCLLLTDGLDRQPQCFAHSLLPVLPLGVHSALLWHSAPSWKDLSCVSKEW